MADIDAFGAHLSGNEELLLGGAIAIPGVIALGAYVLHQLLDHTKSLVKKATS